MSVQLSEYGSSSMPEQEARAIGARRGQKGKKIGVVVLALVLCAAVMYGTKNSNGKPGYEEGRKLHLAQDSKYQVARDSDRMDSVPIRDGMRGEGEWKKMVDAGADAMSVQYFQVGTRTIYFSVANSICQQHGAALASIRSASEQAQAASACTGTMWGCWIGLLRTTPGGHIWKWTGGAPLTYSNWSPGEPNNRLGLEGCATITGSKGWNDNPCSWVGVNPAPLVLCERRQITCSVGSYLSGDQCIQCPPGHYCTNNAKRQCAAGSYQAASGQGACQLAPCGSYVAAAGASSKKLCGAGTYQDKVGQTSCVAVGQGYVSGVGQCTPTKAGEYFSACSASTKSMFGSGWELVRRVGPSYGKWHPETDRLAGTQAFGTFQNSDTVDATFSKTWSTTPFTQFLFATGDCSTWVVASKESAIGSNYIGVRRACRTSDSPTAPSNVFWYNRAANAEDPWISTIDHAQATGTGKIVYGENSIGLYAASVVSAKNGANVFIRNVPLDADGCESSTCASPLTGTWQSGVYCMFIRQNSAGGITISPGSSVFAQHWTSAAGHVNGKSGYVQFIHPPPKQDIKLTFTVSGDCKKLTFSNTGVWTQTSTSLSGCAGAIVAE